jgi:hypothetical protein
MAGCPYKWDQYRANVAAVAVDEHPHNSLLMVFGPSYDNRRAIQDQLTADSLPIKGALYFRGLAVVRTGKHRDLSENRV